MKLEARLARLEKLAGKDSCPGCRLSSHHRWPDVSAPATEDAAPAFIQTCKVCGRRTSLSSSSVPADAGDVARLFFGSSIEASFTDVRVWAAWMWFINWSAAKRERRKFQREVARANRPRLGQYERELAAQAKREAEIEREASPGFRLFSRLAADRTAALKRKRERLVATYGESPAPELAALIEGAKSEGYGHLYSGESFAEKVPFSEMFHVGQEATYRLKCAEAEKIVLGHVAPSTTAALADCERRALELVAAARRKHEAAEEKRRLKEEERERLCREERERKRAPPAMEIGPKAPELTADRPPVRRLLIDNGTLAASARRSAEARAALGHRPGSLPS